MQCRYEFYAEAKTAQWLSRVGFGFRDSQEGGGRLK